MGQQRSSIVGLLERSARDESATEHVRCRLRSSGTAEYVISNTTLAFRPNADALGLPSFLKVRRDTEPRQMAPRADELGCLGTAAGGNPFRQSQSESAEIIAGCSETFVDRR